MKLILLNCPNCSQALKPDNDDIVFACPNCQRPIQIGANGPEIISMRYAIPSSGNDDRAIWVPFWLFNGQVNIRKRETQGRGSSNKDSQKTWEVLHRFFVPAWDLSVHTAQNVGTKLTLRQPEMQIIGQPAEVQLVPAIVSAEDALMLLEFIVLAIEARRKDWLKNLIFDLDVGEPELMALPKATIDRI